MYWNDLKETTRAPGAGQMLAYTRQKVLFSAYDNLDEVVSRLDGEELLEIHLFDCDREYRAVSARSPRFKRGVIETVADFPEDEEAAVYPEKIRLEKGRGAITVLNHISYNENGMAAVDNYRLKMEEAGDE